MGWWSLLPPVLAILLAFITKQVILSLFLGIWIGAAVMAGCHPIWSPFVGFYRSLDTYVVSALADRDHAYIILFSLCLAGLVGIMSRSGGTRGIVRKLMKYAKTPRSGQVATSLMGVIVFFDDYANTLIVGNTMRPLTDRLRISREKLSYIVDSTAAPVASLALISTWIGYEVGLMADGFEKLGIEMNAYVTFIQTIPYRFYSLFALMLVFLISITLRDYGPMLKAERRARSTGKVLADGAKPVSFNEGTTVGDEDLDEEAGQWYNALVPVIFLVVAVLIGLLWSGWVNLYADASPEAFTSISALEYMGKIFGSADSFAVLFVSSVLASCLAAVMVLWQRVLSLGQCLEAWLDGAKSMLMAVVILILAWSLSKVCGDMGTAETVAKLCQGHIPLALIPVMVFILSAFIGFATGTSWGTMGILIPMVIQVVYSMGASEGTDPLIMNQVLLASIGGVLAGSTFGDHCSPISDTTIMSSMASAADHIDHVKTQIPYSMTAACIAALIGYLPAGLGVSPLISIAVGTVVLVAVVHIIGKPSDPQEVEL
ncbi:MAG: Na+/H+ antiporter NhaC family protein [bacterium]|nr:Na+/H+ antiporter NhaC family protein [bacterium]